jgi:hypothetical protein
MLLIKKHTLNQFCYTKRFYAETVFWKSFSKKQAGIPVFSKKKLFCERLYIKLKSKNVLSLSFIVMDPL